MSTLPQQATINQYFADGATVTYIYSFLIPDNNSILVYFTPQGNTANPVTDLVPSANYTVTGAGNVSGGTIVFNTAPAALGVVTLSRNVQLALTTNFSSAMNLNGANLDTAFQLLQMQIQQLQGTYNVNNGQVGSISRCLQYPIDSYIPNVPAPAPNTIPIITNIDNQIWISQGGAIVAGTLANDSMSTLRSQLASEAPGAAGSTLVGYYDVTTNTATTVYSFLNNNILKAAQLQNSYAIAADDTGTANTLVITLTPPLTAYSEYNAFYVKAANANTGAVTLNVNGLGAKPVVHMDGSALLANEFTATMILHLVYDGANFQWQNPIIRVATSAETLTGTNTVLPITPHGLAAAFPVGSQTVQLPGGLILKWGSTGNIAANTNATITFPVAFPNNCFAITAIPSAANSASTIIYSFGVFNTGGFTLSNSVSSSGTANFTYTAIGN